MAIECGKTLPETTMTGDGKHSTLGLKNIG